MRKTRKKDEDKQEIVMHLKHLLKTTRVGRDIDTLLLSDDEETVTIQFRNSYKREVNIGCDSGLAIIQDVVKALY